MFFGNGCGKLKNKSVNESMLNKFSPVCVSNNVWKSDIDPFVFQILLVQCINLKYLFSIVFCLPSRYSFASGSPDNIKQWKFPDGVFLQNLSGHNAIINSLAVNADGVLVSAGMIQFDPFHYFQAVLRSLGCNVTFGFIEKIIAGACDNVDCSAVVSVRWIFWALDSWRYFRNLHWIRTSHAELIWHSLYCVTDLV